MTIKLEAITYEEARLEYFIAQREAAARRIKYWARRAKGTSYDSQPNEEAANAGDEWNFYNDVIGLLGGPKEEVDGD